MTIHKCIKVIDKNIVIFTFRNDKNRKMLRLKIMLHLGHGFQKLTTQNLEEDQFRKT